MTAPVWLDEAFGRPGTILGRSEASPGVTSVFRKLDLEHSVYPTGGWTLTARDHGLTIVQFAKHLLLSPENQSVGTVGVNPVVSVSPGGVLTLKLYRLSGSSYVEVANNYSGVAGSYLWLEFVGLQ